MPETAPERAFLKLLEHSILWFDRKISRKSLNFKHFAPDNRQYIITKVSYLVSDEILDQLRGLKIN
jgi:hypothetical protein